MHRSATKKVGGETVPVLADGGDLSVIDSSDIVVWADKATRSGRRLLPLEPALRADALSLEDLFDEQLGPATRVVAYHYLALDKTACVNMVAPDGRVPSWERTMLKWSFWLIAPFIRSSMNAEAVAKALVTIDDVFSKVAVRLDGGRRRYLVGESFTVADLTFAALASPVLLPPEMPLYHQLWSACPPAYAAVVARYRNTDAGRFAMRMLAEERNRTIVTSTRA